MLDVGDALKGFTEAERRAKFKAEMYGRAASGKMQRRAKLDKPWVDRTGNAKNSIQPECYWRGNTLMIGVGGNMNYSVYLEFKNDNRFAVLYPTLEKMTPEIMRGFAGLL